MNTHITPKRQLVLCGVLFVLGILWATALWVPMPHDANAQETENLTTAPDRATYEGWLCEALIAAQRYDRLGLQQAATKIIATSRVKTTTVSDSFVVVDNRWLADALDTPDPNIEAIATRLAAILDATTLTVDSTLPAVRPDVAQHELDALLSRPPFTNQNLTDNSLIIQFFDWLMRLLNKLPTPVGHTTSVPATIMGWILALLAIAASIAGMIYFYTSMRRSFAPKETHLKPATEKRMSASEAMHNADITAHDGDYRTAMRYLYLSSLLLLDERKLLRYDRALTNQEYLRYVTNEGVRNHLEPVIELFDRVWYGLLPMSATDFAHYRQHVEALCHTKLQNTSQTTPQEPS